MVAYLATLVFFQTGDMRQTTVRLLFDWHIHPSFHALKHRLARQGFSYPLRFPPLPMPGPLHLMKYGADAKYAVMLTIQN